MDSELSVVRLKVWTLDAATRRRVLVQCSIRQIWLMSTFYFQWYFTWYFCLSRRCCTTCACVCRCSCVCISIILCWQAFWAWFHIFVRYFTWAGKLFMWIYMNYDYILPTLPSPRIEVNAMQTSLSNESCYWLSLGGPGISKCLKIHQIVQSLWGADRWHMHQISAEERPWSRKLVQFYHGLIHYFISHGL